MIRKEYLKKSIKNLRYHLKQLENYRNHLRVLSNNTERFVFEENYRTKIVIKIYKQELEKLIA